MGARIALPRLSSMSARILRVYRSADAQQVAAGLAWYPAARDIAGEISADTGLSLSAAAGILAALSPQTSWGQNVSWAREVAAGSNVSRGLGLSQGRAEYIRGYAGDPLDILGGRKVRAFYACIVTAGETDAVCIDRHAYDLAVGTRGAHLSLSDKRAAHAQRAYASAAARLRATGEAPTITGAQLQAITWVTWRARYWAVGAWDGVGADRGRAPETELVAF